MFKRVGEHGRVISHDRNPLQLPDRISSKKAALVQPNPVGRSLRKGVVGTSHDEVAGRDFYDFNGRAFR
jgi:hypothetical protein